jgi:CPA2 family monovalent cation:H+ antiporter-2
VGIAADIIWIVIAGFIGGVIAHRFKQPLLVGYILAGIVLSPNTFGPTVSQFEEIELLAEIGVALLLFGLGLELSLRDLKPVRGVALVGGPLQLIVTTGFGYLIGTKYLGLGGKEAIWFGAMISLSSTMVILKTLSATGMTSTLASRVMIGMLVVQDLALPPMLIALPRAEWSQAMLWQTASSMLQAALFLIAMLVLGTKVFPWALRKVAAWESRELFLLAIVALGVGVGYGTYLFGLSFALGAFVAGIVLSESELSHQALSDIMPLKDIFGLLFFASVGMLFDPHYLLSHISQVAAIVMIVLLGKFLIFFLISKAFGYHNMAPWLIGLGLAQIGEFSFLLARTGKNNGVVSTDLYNLILTATIVTMVLSPQILKLAPPFYRWYRKLMPAKETVRTITIPDFKKENHIIIAGCGRTGTAAVQVMNSASIPHVIIENSHARASLLRDKEMSVIWGDCTSTQILEAAEISSAKILMITMPDWETTQLTVIRAKAINPGLHLVVRAGSKEQVAKLRELGVSDVVQSEYEGGLALVRQALEKFDFPLDQIRELYQTAKREMYAVNHS